MYYKVFGIVQSIFVPNQIEQLKDDTSKRNEIFEEA